MGALSHLTLLVAAARRQLLASYRGGPCGNPCTRFSGPLIRKAIVASRLHRPSPARGTSPESQSSVFIRQDWQ